VRGRHQQVLDVVVVLAATAPHAPAPSALAPERVGGHGLDVALVGADDDDLLVVDEVEVLDVAGVVGDLGAPLVGVLAPKLTQLGLTDKFSSAR